MRGKIWSLLACWAIMTSCQKQENEPTLFEELRADQTSITFSNDLSESEDFNIIEYLYYYNGGGVAIGDINDDGLPDIYFTANEGENKLYLNEGDLRFRDITQEAGVASPGLWKTGASMVDVNGDGWLDIYQTRVSGYKGLSGNNELYINNGDLTFTESAKTWGLDFAGFSTHSGFFDMDQDGDLDLYLLNHAVHTPSSFGKTALRNRPDPVSGDRIFENLGEVFVDITAETGIYSSAIGYGLGLGFTDFDQDGYTDIYVSNDFSENDYLYRNNGDRTFTEILEKIAHRTSRFSMGNDLADLNNDGLVDIMTLDMMPEDETIRKRSAGDDSYEVLETRRRLGYMEQFGRNSVLMNLGNGHLMDVALMTGLYATDWSWSTLIADFDQDGKKDVFVSNGIWKRPNDLDFIDFTASSLAQDPNLSDAQFTSRMPEGKISNYFFRNDGDWAFEDVSDSWATLHKGVTNGATYADLDQDGDLDIVLNNLNQQSTILKNMSREGGSNYLIVEFVAGGHYTHQGARVICWANGEAQSFESFANRGFQSSTSGPIVIGLGSAEKIDSLVIEHQGKRWSRSDVAINQTIQVDLQALTETSGMRSTISWFEQTNETFGTEFIHRENTYWEFTREPLMPHMNSYEGPGIAVGDVNSDGLQDIFLGGASKQPAQLYLQQMDRNFSLANFPSDSTWEDVDVAFFDFENDGDLDILVVSGGNDYVNESIYRQPRLYLQEGQQFYRDTTALPPIFHTGSTVAVYDYNGDGFDDIFLGSLVVPWNYGVTPKSYLLTNKNGKELVIDTHKVPRLEEVGMVKDAAWADVDGNGEKDLIVAALWEPIKVFYTKNGELGEPQILFGGRGWWQTVMPIDFDDDGDMDVVLGNLGLNTKLKASAEEPVRLYIKDIDGNNRLDHVLTYYRDGKESAFASKKDLVKPLSYINRRFRDYKGYAEAELDEIFGQENLRDAEVLEANEFRSGILVNDAGRFSFRPFSTEAQSTMIRSITFEDFDGDGRKELFLAGNFSQSTLQDAPYTEGYGVMYQVNEGQMNFIPNAKHGIYLEGNVVATRLMDFGSRTSLFVLKNDDAPEWWVSN